MRASTTRRAFSAIEFCAIFLGIPLAIALIRRPGLLAAALWGGAILAWAATRASPPDARAVPLRLPLARFLILAPLLTLAVWLATPDHFLDLPRHKPILWAAIMLLYPALSVWPQEIIYRRFIFRRYAALLPHDAARIAASAAAFGFAHVIFLNPWAVLLTIAGGLLFGQTYARSRSLRASAVEHALYGCLVFTIGLGRFFYTGAAWHH